MRYLINLVVAAASVLLAAAAANYWFDPAQLFHTGYEARVAKLLKAGESVAVRPNYDERLLQKLLIDGMEMAPEIVTFGSSRSMQVTQSIFGKRSFANHSVSGATLEDHLAIYQLYRNKSMLPKVVIIEVDPWIFNKNYKSPAWQILRAEHQKITFDLGQHRTEPNSDGRLKQLISLSYLTTSLKSAITGSRTATLAPTPIDSEEADVPIRRPDGSLILPTSTRNRSLEQIRSNARTYLTPPVYGLETFREIDPAAWQLFSALISLQKKEHTRTVLFLAPYHPETFALLSAKPEYRIIRDIETSLRQLARKDGLDIIGSYSSTLANCQEIEFTDGMHPTASCVGRILASWFHPNAH